MLIPNNELNSQFASFKTQHEAVVSKLTADNQCLKQRIAKLQQMLFGRSSERRAAEEAQSGQVSLFEVAPSSAPKQEEAPTIEVAGHTRKVRDRDRGEEEDHEEGYYPLHLPRVERTIDNGAAERVIRPVKLGAKNWLFAASETGADTIATFYSLIYSSIMHGIHPYYYLLDLCKRLDQKGLKALDLTPRHWKARFFVEAVPEHLRQPP